MKRCICGQSSRFPLCDGQHKQEGWTCAKSSKQFIPLGILAGENYFSLAEKLAHHLQARLIEFSVSNSVYQKLLILTDGTDLEQISLLLEQTQYKEAQIITIGIPSTLLENRFSKITSISEISANMRHLWSELLLAISTQNTASDSQKPKKIFISHSTKDGELLIPVINYLRRYLELEIFLCSDSILVGELWYAKITKEIEDADVVIALHSYNFVHSHFCSFEMGMTRALQKRLLIIGLDSTTLPVFLQDIQTEFLEKNQEQKPWLSKQEALIDLIINKL